MFIKTLKITSDNTVIRELQFHKGMNLIIDNTPLLESEPNMELKTGNNVGKTTVLKLIDYCFGASAKGIYADLEGGKQTYDVVKDFLIDNKVLITLILKRELDDEKSEEIVITRNFLPRNKIVRTINGKGYKEDEFEVKLRELMYPDLKDGKPSLRQILSHSIRYTDGSIGNTLKTLDRFTSDAEYETLFLYLFGCKFENGEEKQSILLKIRQEASYKDRLEKQQTKNAYEAALAIIDREIEKLNEKKTFLNINENYEDDLAKLNQIKYEITKVSAQIGNYEIRKSLIIETQEEMSSETSHIDIQQLRQIYMQASTQLEKMQKTFEELVEYHNKMIIEKVKFISKELPELEIKIKEENSRLSQLLEDEKKYSAIVAKSDSFAELEKLMAEINEKYRKKGEYESVISQLDEVETNLKEFNGQLQKIDGKIFSEEYEKVVKDQVNKFNQYFSAISQELYGETYAIKYEIEVNKKKQQLYKFSAFNANMSSGKKQGEILCFDIAYVQFADNENIPCVHFLLNDKKELVHDNQLVKVTDYIKDKNIQFVASILKDKLPEKLKKPEYYIVELSQDDKLFRIENGKL